MNRMTRTAVETALALAVLGLFVAASTAVSPDWSWVLGPALLGAVFGVLWAADAVLPSTTTSEGA